MKGSSEHTTSKNNIVGGGLLRAVVLQLGCPNYLVGGGGESTNDLIKMQFPGPHPKSSELAAEVL